jgi:simple sugar transport system ATP-binding protein
MLAKTHQSPPPLELVNVTKRFGSFVANEKVSFKVAPGTFHALLGENGAGKSTIVKCIMGYHAADEGDIIVDSASREIRNPHDAHRLGIGMVYQHFTVVPAMTVAENLVLSRPDLPRIIPWKAERARLEKFLETAPFQVPLDALISELAAGQKQKVEILKQLYLDCKLLILDEPTSVLTPQEADEVLGLLRGMVTEGRLSVLMITHKFREVTAFCDEITVLRKGRVTGSGRVEEMTPASMAALMMGEQRSGQSTERAPFTPGPTRLEIHKISALRDSGTPGLTDLSLNVRAGEIVGVAGISGNGQRELVEVLAGQRRKESGAVRVNGVPFSMTRREIARHQIYVLPEEPLRNACAPQMSVAENIALRVFDRPPLSLGGILLRGRQVRSYGEQWIERFRVKTTGPDAPIATLSGGNVQRAVLARDLGPGTAKVLIAANPCFGLDFAAVDFIHAQLLAARNQGVAILLISEDLDELLALSDRVVVMAAGRIVYESPVEEADVRVMGEHMAGH